MFSKNHVKTYYEILNIDKSATCEQIKSAYHKKALNLHPDKNPHRETKEQMQEVNQAYTVLSDELSRMEYDRSITSSDFFKNNSSEHPFSKKEPSFFRENKNHLKQEIYFEQWKATLHINHIFIFHPSIRGAKDNISLFNIAYNPEIALPINGDVFLQRRLKNFLSKSMNFDSRTDNTTELMCRLPQNTKLQQEILRSVFNIYKVPESITHFVYEKLCLPLPSLPKRLFEELFEITPNNYSQAQFGKWNLKLTKAHLFITHPDLIGCKSEINIFNMYSKPSLALPINNNTSIKEFLKQNVVEFISPLTFNDIEIVLELPNEKGLLEKIFNAVFYIYNFPEELIACIQTVNLTSKKSLFSMN